MGKINDLLFTRNCELNFIIKIHNRSSVTCFLEQPPKIQFPTLIPDQITPEDHAAALERHQIHKQQLAEVPNGIECEGWRRHSSLIFLILQFTKPNIEVSGWLYQTKTHFTHIVYQPFSRVSPPSFTLYDSIASHLKTNEY